MQRHSQEQTFAELSQANFDGYPSVSPPTMSTSTTELSGKDILVRKRRYSAKFKKWSAWEVLSVRQKELTSDTVSFPLQLGGSFHIYPNLLSPEQQKDLTDELMENKHLFRQYYIQGNPEPRAQFLLHENSTQDYEIIQPGYKYAQTTMKAKPLSLLPNLHIFSRKMQNIFKVPSWNVGVNPIYYRDSRDYMGFHADDDQGEEKILTVLIKSPATPRRIIFQRAPDKLSSDRKRKRWQDGDEQTELSLGAGDGYEMDGEMQKHYVHGVPPDKSTGIRIAIVFRHGRYSEYKKDSGQPLTNLAPRAIIPRAFGQIEGLKEGDSYTRAHIHQLGAHCQPQAGISGNKTDGCEAIVVSCAREDGLGNDCFEELVYAAETKVGASRVLTSMAKNKCIRIFRSSAAFCNPYRALPNENGPTLYRYDGLYQVQYVTYFDNDGIERIETHQNVSPAVPHRIYQFHLERIQVGDDAYTNRMSIEKLMEYSILKNTLGPEAQVARLVCHYCQEMMSQINILQPESFSAASITEEHAHEISKAASILLMMVQNSLAHEISKAASILLMIAQNSLISTVTLEPYSHSIYG